MNISLDDRLLSCANLVRAGAVFADIGTDHGYLPVFLLTTGRISKAYLSDINKGPLESAVRNADEYGVRDRCEFLLTDGARELAGRGITDYTIAGMGGTLIADIISKAEQLYDSSVRLILQPMTKQAYLRRFLAEEGFEMLSEEYSYSDGKYYVTMCASYRGEKRSISDIEAELGKSAEHTHDRAEFLGYFKAKLASVRRARDGRAEGGLSVYDEDALIKEIEKLLKTDSPST